MKAIAVFSDLDGTLLDHDTYGVRMSVQALDLMVRRGLPVIPVSSKTSAEIRRWMKILFLDGPFISENGCGVVIPRDFLKRQPDGAQGGGSEWKISVGKDIQEVRRLLDEAALEAGVQYRSFSQMSEEDLHRHTGLSGRELSLCRQREFDEPFLLYSEEDAGRIQSSSASRGLVITRGGRFYHATGGCDKGRAVRIVSELLLKEQPGLLTVAIGDSHNDLPMFLAVDKAYLVAKPDGTFDAGIPAEAAVRVPAEGPKGFRTAIEEVITFGREG